MYDISIHSPFHVLNAYSIRVWYLHAFSIPRVKCLQYTCVTIPSILHSTCKMLTVYVCDISIHSPFHVLNAYSIRVLQFHPFSIPRFNCIQYTCMTSPYILHSTYKMLTLCVFDNSIHSPFIVLTVYSIHVWHLHTFSIPRVKCLQYACLIIPSILHWSC
jgi:hypothetical protein